jgi:hypothetical protein
MKVKALAKSAKLDPWIACSSTANTEFIARASTLPGTWGEKGARFNVPLAETSLPSLHGHPGVVVSSEPDYLKAI